MIRYRTAKNAKGGERGVTMILVAIAMFSMLAMLALAIDVITLYSARSEAQSAADAAALAAAKMLVDSGVTADPQQVSDPSLQATAQTLATKVAQDVAGKATITGQAIQPADVTVTFPNTGQPSFGFNPTVSVTVQNTNLPTFFSRIWSRGALTVRASAKAEAFNPSNASSLGTGIPTVARCVKPFLLPNCGPVNPNNPGSACGGTVARFFDPTTGAIINPAQYPAGVIGETFHMVFNCGQARSVCWAHPPAPQVHLHLSSCITRHPSQLR